MSKKDDIAYIKQAAEARAAVTHSFVDDAMSFALEAIRDKKNKVHGKKIQKAAQRFIDDLGRAQQDKCSFVFIPEYAEIYCEFIELLPHVEGKWETPNIKLIPAQSFFVVQLFGFRQRQDKSLRRFSKALYAVARKNAKSTLAAAILIACACLEKELGQQILTAATTGSQARIVWKIIKRMLERSPALLRRYKLRPRANDIQERVNGGEIKPINAKASTQDGLNPSHIGLDEIHAHPNHDLVNVLFSAAGARTNPLTLFTTTEGYENPGPWAEERNFSDLILDKVVEADHYLAVLFCIDDDDDEFDESIWQKANPLMVSNPLILIENRKLAAEARGMPGKLSEFKIKRLNRPASVAEGWINLLKWKACQGTVDLKKMEKLKCWGGLDLASTLDMNALRWLWQDDEDPDKFYTWGRYWVPREMVRVQKEAKRFPYDGWANSGQIITTEGDVTDYDKIKKDILEDVTRFRPEKLAYDPWNATQLANELVDKNVDAVQFIQGTKSYNPAMKFFQRTYVAGLLVHDGNKVLTWNMANLVSRQDINNNLAPDRKNAKGKIDGAAALIMAFGLAEVGEEGYVTSSLVAG